jgi:hypothetical protein
MWPRGKGHCRFAFLKPPDAKELSPPQEFASETPHSLAMLRDLKQGRFKAGLEPL